MSAWRLVHRRVDSCTATLVAVVAAAMVAASCGQDQAGERTTGTTPTRTEPPAALDDAASPPDPELLLSPLEDYATEDDVDAGEVETSLDHGSVPYVDVRRRLVLDDRGFTAGEVMVVTLEPESGGAERFLAHWYGDAPRTPVDVEGVEMLRIEAEPHAALAWTGPTFVVTFERGQERDDAWLDGLAGATVAALAEE